MNGKYRILVVDDEEDIRKSFKIILEEEGYSVDTASTGQEAITKTEKTFYNLAILDIHLPDMDGVELLKSIKDYFPRTRKIMMTGYPSLKNTIASLNNKADFFMVKPVDVVMLLAIMKEQLVQQEQEKKLCQGTSEPFPGITFQAADTIHATGKIR